MLDSLKGLFTTSILARLSLLFFLVLTGWWITIYWRGLVGAQENDLFTLIYPWLSLVGSIYGFRIASQWGGVKSLLGKALASLSLGLLLQFIGQATYAFYIYVLSVEVPYPSVGDIGYFGSVIAYLVGTVYLARAVAVKHSLRSFPGQAWAVLLPIIMLLMSYLVFLKGYEFDLTTPLTILLDFGYPFGQALYVAMAILTLILSRKYLGGMMRTPVIFLIVALVFQYFSDYTFLYQVSREQWYVGGVNDYMYLVSYLLMTLALISVGLAFDRIRKA